MPTQNYHMSGRIRSNSGALHVQQISSSVGVNGCDGHSMLSQGVLSRSYD